MKAVVAGGYDTENLGDHASLIVLKQELEKIDPNFDIVVLSRHPSPEFDVRFDVRSIKNLDHANKAESIGRLFNGFNQGDSSEHLRVIFEELSSADLLIIGNGRLFVDISLDFMRGPLPYFALLVTLARFMGIPVFIFSMTIVPIASEIGNVLLKYILANSTLITVREENSRDEVLKHGIREGKVVVCPDAAFGLDVIGDIEIGRKIVGDEKINLLNDRMVAANFKYTNLNMNFPNEMYAQCASFCDWLVDSLDVDVLMVPQMTYNVDNKLDDDRELYSLIHSRCLNKKRIHPLKGRYDVKETLSIYHLCEMVLSMRRHGLIMASTQFLPIFAIVGEKNTSYVTDTLGIDRCSIKINDLSSEDSLKNIFESFRDRKHVSRLLMDRVPELRSKVGKYSSLLSHVVGLG